jgi:hypothetical protein
MTFLEAINRTEAALSELGLQDRWGDPIEGIEACGIVAHAVGKDWDSTLNLMEAGEIAPEEYCAKILNLIQRFSRKRFSRRMDARLSELKLGQIELGLVLRKGASYGDT